LDAAERAKAVDAAKAIACQEIGYWGDHKKGGS
jgi:hypothetical protein